mmetsp:Transcript_31095/g.82843  ORF Transcript_31095/g.82843 Transcript_31095/m.82843 type:complete len:231 (+) Transcript_31095:420-1112(+)
MRSAQSRHQQTRNEQSPTRCKSNPGSRRAFAVLLPHEFRIETASAQELGMRTHLTHLALFQNNDAICGPNRGEAVRNDKGRTSLHQSLQGLLHSPLRVRVQCGGGLVQDEQARILQQRPGDGHALLLATRERGAGIADLGVQASRQALGEVVHQRRLGGLGHLGVRRTWPAVADVVADGAREQSGLLFDVGDLPSQLPWVQRSHVTPIYPHGPVLAIIKALCKPADRRLA